MMIKKKMSRFFGPISERSAPEPSAPEHAPPSADPVQPQAQPHAAVGSLMSALQLTSHAHESPLTEQEKRMAWELPARVPDPDEALVPRSTSKARLLLPELEQMRQTQSMLMSGYAAAAEDHSAAGTAPGMSPNASSTEEDKPRTKRRRAARPKQTAESVRQTTPRESSPAPAPERPKHEPTRSQLPPATRGWEYSMMLQRAEDAAPPPASTPASAPAATSGESSLSSMFERLRSHSKKPPTPPAAVPKAPGFLNKLWAK